MSILLLFVVFALGFSIAARFWNDIVEWWEIWKEER